MLRSCAGRSSGGYGDDPKKVCQNLGDSFRGSFLGFYGVGLSCCSISSIVLVVFLVRSWVFLQVAAVVLVARGSAGGRRNWFFGWLWYLGFFRVFSGLRSVYCGFLGRSQVTTLGGVGADPFST